MKIKINCDSPLLQETLEIFLRAYIDKKGTVISDNPQKGEIIIGKDIKKPFTKTSLLIQLEKILKISDEKTFDDLLDELIEEFTKNLKKLIKDYYGKR